jgi:hypothetical protein
LDPFTGGIEVRSTNRRTWHCSSALALSVFAFLAAGGAAAGDRWDYWDPRASIPARVIDTHLGVVALAATIAGDYRTAAVFDHLSGRYPAAVPVVQHVYYPPPVVEHVYYPPPRPIVVHHVHNGGCGHAGYDRGHGHRHGHGRKYVRGHGRGHRGGWDRDDRWDD